MKIDMHVHSKFSKRPSEWVLKRLGCPESFTEPIRLYHLAKKRGMSLVTITDHNCIDGCLEIAHLGDTFISEEVTTYLPEDRCKLHVVVYDIDEAIHREIQGLRENALELIPYLRQRRITHVLAHPLYSVNGKISIENVEKCLLLFKNFELNGARNGEQNRVLGLVCAALTPEELDKLQEKHGIEPPSPFPWKKSFTGGSDDHSSLTVALKHTLVEGAHDLEGFLKGVEEGNSKVVGFHSTPRTLARNIYSIAYQFYDEKFNLGKYVSSDLIFKFLDRFLHVEQVRSPHLLARFNSYWKHRMGSNGTSGKHDVWTVLRNETHRLIWDDPQFAEIFGKGAAQRSVLDEQWFRFVDTSANKVLFHFADHIAEGLSGANFLNAFHSLGSAGALYSLLAPYFAAYSIFSQDRIFGRKVQDRFIRKGPEAGNEISTAHFTDTFYEVNGVSGTLRMQVRAARRSGKKYAVLTCDAKNHAEEEGIRNFKPIGIYNLSVYPEQKLFYPPFLEMLNYCYEEGFTHIHSATPGPLGLAALGIARILKLPIVGTYHTALPQYARYVTDDSVIEKLMWRYIVWYYDQMDLIYVPSKATAKELAEKGVNPLKIRLFPRGVDVERFHPSKRNGLFDGVCKHPDGLKFLYVGRVSKEKNLELLVKVFKEIEQSGRKVNLVVVGDGPYREEMESILEGSSCVFTGYLEGEKLAAAYASCHLFVFPSTTDTFGNVVLEAQASGLPVIVTNCGGPQENMLPGVTGLVVNGNDERSLMEALEHFVQDPCALQTMGTAARAYVQTRSFDHAFKEAWQLYSEATTTKSDLDVPWGLFAGKAGLMNGNNVMSWMG